jgi:hypothetical protein
MVTISRKNKIVIISLVVVASLVAVALPIASAQAADTTISKIKALKAQGNIYQRIDSNTIKYYPASLTLTLQPDSTNGLVKKFDITGGTLMANGISFTFTNGNGEVLTGRHVILLKVQGTNPDGQAITLKLAGQYSWLSGNTLKIEAKLQTDDANYTLLMHAPI